MNTHNLYEQRQSFYLTPSSTARGGLTFCILVGVVAFIGGLYMGQSTRTWGALLFNTFFFFSIALGGIAFSGMQDVISAKWGRPVMRLHEGFAAFLPIGALLLLFFLLAIATNLGGAHDVYSWIANPESIAEYVGKRDWLKEGFMLTRDAVAVVVILALAFWQLRLKLSRDLAFVAGDKARAERLGELAHAKLRHWSAPVLVVYALAFSLLTFDLTMSLAPTWYSTLWGGWSFAVMMQTLMASLLSAMYIFKHKAIGRVIHRQQFHDVGKLMHGFTIFFAYLTYAHILTYWYGNIPEETEYFIHRMHQPWLSIVIVAPLLVFIFPLFALIPKASKWTAALSLPITGAILLAQWLIAMLIVMPQVVAEPSGLPWVEVCIFLGVLGLFLASYFWFGKRYPMVAVGDPLLAEALAEAAHH